jgi:hypothetical protein
MPSAEIRLRVDETPNLRNELGQYTSAGVQEMRDRNQRYAISLQSQVALRMRNHIAFGRRPNVSTGRLLRSTIDARNILVDQYYVGVGRPDWLDKSVARYWRTFEEGSAAVWRRPFAGMQLRGRFGGSIVGWAPTRTPGPQPQPLAGGPWNAQGGKLRWYWTMPLNDNFVVKREIQPANIYAEVAREGNLNEYAVASALRWFDRVFSRGLSPSTPPYFYGMR